MTLKEYLRGSRDLSLNVLLVIPALLAYEAGVWLLGPPVRNGAQLLLRELFLLIGPSGVLVLNAVLIATAVVCAVDALKRYSHVLARFAYLGVECLAYAAVLGPLVLLIQEPVAGALAMAEEGPGAARLVAEKVVLALGAGAYEELFFRLLLMSAVYHAAVGMFREHQWAAWAAALAVSSVVFSLCHHDLVLPGGEPFRADVFFFRAVAGALLGLVFFFRGFAAAVYTHAFYNLLVFFR